MDEKKGLFENSWEAYCHYVLKQLEADSRCMAEIKKEVTVVKVEIGKLKVKSGIWGLAGGVIPAVGLLLYTLLK